MQYFKGALSGLRQFLAFKSLFSLTAFFVLKMFKFLSWPFSHVEKQLDSKDEANLKLYDVTIWETNNIRI